MSKIIDSLFVSIGIDPEGAKRGFQEIQQSAQKTDAEFNNLAQKWAGTVKGLISTVIAPVAGAFAVGSIINSYMSDISQVATMTGAYSQKLEEWRLKRAQLARVTKEDIELYKKSREAITSFKIAMGDLSASIMRQSMPIMKLLIDGLNKFTAWVNRNMKNITRSITVAAGVLTTVFLPAFLKVGAAMLTSPLTWVVAAIGMLALVIDDLVTYMQGGKSALSGFWSMFGTGEEITKALTSAFEILKSVVSVLAKPVAMLAAGFVAFKGGTVIIGGIVKAVTSLRTALTALAANPIIAVMMALLSIILWITDAFKRANGQWGNVFKIMLQDVIDFLNIFGGFGDFLVNIFSSIGDKIQPVIEVISSCVLGILEPFQGLFDAVTGIFGSFIDIITNGVKYIWGAITGDSDKNQSALLDGIANAASGLLSNIGNLISEAFGLIVSYITGLPKAIWTGLTTIVPMYINFMSSLGEIVLNAASAIGNGVLNALSAVWDILKTLFGAVPSYLSGIGSGIVESFNSIGSSISDMLSGMLSGMISGLASWISDVAGSGMKAYQSLIDGVSQGASKAFDTIKKGISKAIDFIGNILGYAFTPFISALQTALTWTQKIFDAVKSVITKAISNSLDLLLSLGSSVSGAFEAVKNAVSAALGLVLSAVSGVFNQLVNVISNALSTASGYISGFISGALGFFQSLFQAISGVFGQIVDVISNALSSAIESVSNFVSSIFDYFRQIPEFLSQVFDIGSLIDKATNALKDKAKDAWKDVKGFFGMEDDEESQPNQPTKQVQNELTSQDKPKLNQDNQSYPELTQANKPYPKSTQANKPYPEPTYSQAQNNLAEMASSQPTVDANASMSAFFTDLRQGMNSMMQEFAVAPVAADTTSMVTNTYQSNTKNISAQRNNSTTININAPSGDPRAIARVLRTNFPGANSSMSYVSASESGNWNM